mmetsp:Transcript_8368/g.21603  ORF Transcript_8368/g.21603 Transcript_8368/m.21603 type:complete len:241 (+) Transcript_8368:65-787(+)
MHPAPAAQLWPLDGVASAAMLSAASGLRPAVLLCTGAFNPVHAGHLEAMRAARSCARAHGFDPIIGLLSPSHDLYVRPKCAHTGATFVGAQERCGLVDLACAQSAAWLRCARWESASFHGEWPDFDEVAQALAAELAPGEDLVDARRIAVLYVCGADHFHHTDLHDGLNPKLGIGVIALPRGPADEHNLVERPERLVFVAEPTEHVSVSSTQVRDRVRNGQSIHGLVPASAELEIISLYS